MLPVSIDDLKKIVALCDLPDDHLHWILDHSDYFEFEDGDMIAKYGAPADVMWIAVEGKVNFYMNINGRLVYYFTFENNQVSGGVGGLLPYSRMVNYPGNSYASGHVKLLRIHKKYFPELELLNPAFTQKLIGYMTERAKAFATTQLQHEKVNALGNLAAGIAHELNNPAAAIKGISNELTQRLDRNFELTKKLLAVTISPGHIETIHAMVVDKTNHPSAGPKLSTLHRMEIEDEIEDWLEKNGVPLREAAETFSEFGWTVNELESIRKDLGPDAFIPVIPWLENLISSQKIILDLAEASNRISHLVGAIKSHVHMDRTNDLQPTNVHQDIENTITLLAFKLREKNIEVKKLFCPDLPLVPAFVGELNQVWTNLIDNAIFALEKNGELTIRTFCDPKTITVCIEDNGIGIPKEIRSRIFDPFFTTKKVGEGSGIGLDIVSRIVKRHNGEIKLDSEPGKTVFSVTLPLVQHEESK
ncbi:ATP-binding protein [Flavihumibacter fluvii]|uniref:ATP-binding protein n=1 Tax=Flavihumibacter fluvii TaxID=2838157 RepID=UPI001BDEB756|nr:ATP-binding protein [Flavihumibacter fluvii]ULQ53336.1 ATP-binding protein [Flavihumibacter fluvii]